MKKALVTGAAGFIGSHVVEQLLQENVEVRALLRPGEPDANLRGLECEIRQGDLLDKPAIDSAVQGVDTVFHLAAIYSIWMKDWSRMYEVNLQGSRNVLWSALKHSVEKVVYTSSIAAIGIAPGTELSDESTPFNQHTLGSHYVLTKYLSQQEALGFAEHGLDLSVVNPAFPFGDRDIAPTPTGQMIIDILAGVNRFYFDGGINLVDVNDVARGHVLAAKRGQRGGIYILSNLNISMKDFIQLVHRVASMRTSLKVKLPIPLLKSASSALSWWSDHVSNKPPLSTPIEVEYASNYLYFDNSKAKKELGLEFSPIEDSLAAAIRWFQENGYVKVH
jgi:dihydroflavonol-4-reductase